MTDWASPRRTALLLAGLLAGGCTFTHRCPIPTPVVEAAPGPRVPLPVAVKLLPGDVPAEVTRSNAPMHRWVVDAAPPTRDLFERLAASAFEPPAPEAGGAAPSTLEVALTGLDFQFADPIAGPYLASVAYRARLLAPDGAPVATWELAGSARQPLVWELSTHCAGIGRAVARAMQEAGGALVAKLGDDAVLAAFLQARGQAMPRLAVRAPESYPASEEPPGPPGASPAAAPGPAPVDAGRAMGPRTFHLRTGVGFFVPDEASGRLEEGGRGIAFTVLGSEYRPLPWLGVELEGGTVGRAFSGRPLPPAGAFAVPRAIFLRSTLLGLGLRLVAPGGAAEPWVGAPAQLLRTELSGSYSIFGFPGTGWSETSWSPGLDLGTGVYLHLGSHWMLAVDLRRLLARASFDLFRAGVSIGGWGGSVALGATLP